MTAIESLKALEGAYDKITGETGSGAKLTAGSRSLIDKLGTLAQAIEQASAPRIVTAPTPAAAVTPLAPTAAPKAQAGLSDDQWCDLGRAALGITHGSPDEIRDECIASGLRVPGLPEPTGEATGRSRMARSFKQSAVNAWLAKNGF